MLCNPSFGFAGNNKRGTGGMGLVARHSSALLELLGGATLYSTKYRDAYLYLTRSCHVSVLHVAGVSREVEEGAEGSGQLHHKHRHGQTQRVKIEH